MQEPRAPAATLARPAQEDTWLGPTFASVPSREQLCFEAASRVAAQHSQNYAPWYSSVPGLVVIAPYDASDAKGLLKAAIRSEDPVVFLENELVYGRSFDVPDMDSKARSGVGPLPYALCGTLVYRRHLPYAWQAGSGGSDPPPPGFYSQQLSRG